MRKLFFLLILSFLACNTKTIVLSELEINKQKETINQLLDDWHKAATNTDLDAYFSKMTGDAIYLGTDASERWTKDEFYMFCKPYFDKGKAWEFKPKDRTVYFSKNYKTAWFEETLDTWMGECRGSGVIISKDNSWKIIHYNLAVVVPNNVIKEYIKLLK